MAFWKPTKGLQLAPEPVPYPSLDSVVPALLLPARRNLPASHVEPGPNGPMTPNGAALRARTLPPPLPPIQLPPPIPPSPDASRPLKLGDVVSVLTRSPRFRGRAVSELEAFATPPLMNGQVLLAVSEPKAGGVPVPLAVALWASVEPEVDRRLEADTADPPILAPHEWLSGDIPWLITLAGEGRLLVPRLKQMQDGVLMGRPFKVRRVDRDDNRVRNHGDGADTYPAVCPAVSALLPDVGSDAASGPSSHP